jgi:hypothetical protein
MPLLPAKLPPVAYLAAAGGAFVLAKLATRPPAAAPTMAAGGTPAPVDDSLWGSYGEQGRQFGGGGSIGFLPGAGGYSTSDMVGGQDLGGTGGGGTGGTGGTPAPVPNPIVPAPTPVAAPPPGPTVTLRFGAIRIAATVKTIAVPAGQRANVRTGPATTYAIVTTLVNGAHFTAYQRTTGQRLCVGSSCSATWYGDSTGTRWLHASAF